MKRFLILAAILALLAGAVGAVGAEGGYLQGGSAVSSSGTLVNPMQLMPDMQVSAGVVEVAAVKGGGPWIKCAFRMRSSLLHIWITRAQALELARKLKEAAK